MEIAKKRLSASKQRISKLTMDEKPISPAAHGLIDYALVASLLILPTVLGLSKAVKQLYTAQALTLLGYVAISEHPLAVKPMIPFRVHGMIDPFNVATFALQSLLSRFREDNKALAFNVLFTLLSGITVFLTDYDSTETEVGDL